MRKKSKARWLIALCIALVLLVVFSAVDIGFVNLPWAGRVYVGGWPPKRFDSTEWKSADGYVGQMWSHGPLWDDRRATMVSDLLSRLLHKGMTKADVQRLLGRPSAEGGSDSEWEQVYPLLAFPRFDQRLIAMLRWGTTDPSLILDYDSKHKLRAWRVK